jgi:hypothetical protein
MSITSIDWMGLTSKSLLSEACYLELAVIVIIIYKDNNGKYILNERGQDSSKNIEVDPGARR